MVCPSFVRAYPNCVRVMAGFSAIYHVEKTGERHNPSALTLTTCKLPVRPSSQEKRVVQTPSCLLSLKLEGAKKKNVWVINSGGNHLLKSAEGGETHWNGPDRTRPLRSSLWTRAFLYFFIELYHFLWFIIVIRGSHVRIKAPVSALREESSRAECGRSLGFHFQSASPSSRRVCLNSLPDAIKGM